MSKLIASFARDERGATAVEYGIISALVCVGMIVGATALGSQINSVFNTLKTTLSNGLGLG